MYKTLLTIVTAISLLTACSEDGDMYDRTKHSEEEFSVENTAALLVGIAAVAAIAEGGGYGGGQATDYDWDWGYQPANFQWVCRGVQSGQYAAKERCAFDLKIDDRWPG